MRLDLRTVGVLCAVVIALGAWSRGLGGPYLFDDFTTPISDPASQSLSAWASNLRPTLRPVTKLTYAIEAQLGLAESPSIRRGISLVMHGATAVLFWLLLRRWLPSVTALGAGAFALIWLVHPVHADGVLLISGRTTVLSNLFLIATLLALGRSYRWLAALAFALACLSRETALAALIPLGVLVALKHQGRWRDALRESTPILLSTAFVVCWILLTPRYMQLAEYSMLGRPVWLSLIRQVSAVPVGFSLLGAPASLSIDYGIPLASALGQPLFLLGALMYLGAAVGIAVFFRRHPAVSLGLAIWLAALLPTQSFVPKLDALANRPLSLALAGLLLAVAPLAGAVFGRVRWPVVAAAASAAMVFTMLAAETTRRATLFQSPLAVWRDAAVKSTTNERPHVVYAILLQQQGRSAEALQSLSLAARIDPFDSGIDEMLRVFRSQEVRR